MKVIFFGVLGESPLGEGVVRSLSLTTEFSSKTRARGSRNEHGCVKFPARLSPSLLVQFKRSFLVTLFYSNCHDSVTKMNTKCPDFITGINENCIDFITKYRKLS